VTVPLLSNSQQANYPLFRLHCRTQRYSMESSSTADSWNKF